MDQDLISKALDFIISCVVANAGQPITLPLATELKGQQVKFKLDVDAEKNTVTASVVKVTEVESPLVAPAAPVVADPVVADELAGD